MRGEFYAEDWEELAAEIKEANGYTCQACNVECRRERSDRTKPVLTVAHYDHEYETDVVFLVPLCARCHLIHDAPFGWQARRRWSRWRQRQAGQMEWLFHERR